MQAIIGFVLGIATVILLREYAVCQPIKKRERRAVSEHQKRAQQEYEEFLRYNGDEL